MFLAKTILVPPMALAMCIYLAVKAGSGGDFFHRESTVTGSTRVWLWLASMTSLTGKVYEYLAGYDYNINNILRRLLYPYSQYPRFLSFCKEARPSSMAIAVYPLFYDCNQHLGYS